MIPVAEPMLGEREQELVADAVESGWISPKGEYVDRFEAKFASFADTETALATSTGTAALHLALVAAGVGEGDEVLVPSLTWIACANTVTYVGADPVFVDVDPDTYTMDPDAAREAVTEDTEAMMPVHLYGHPCDMDPLLDLADEHNLTVIEDCAEAHGATYEESPVGSIGDIGCFSFYANKVFTTGQGGMITTGDPELADRVYLYRRDGMSEERKYYHPMIGYNYRLTNVQAALGVAQLERAETIIEKKRAVGEQYTQALNHLPVTVNPNADWASSVYWMNTAVFDSEDTKERVVAALSDADIETRPFFVPLHHQPPYQGSEWTPCPVAERLHKRGINLPSSPKLDSDSVSTVCDRLRAAI